MKRRNRMWWISLLVLMLFTGDNGAHAQPILLNKAFPNLTFSSPVGLYQAGDGTDRVFVVSQSGYIYVFPNDPSVTAPRTFLDIHDSLVSGGELGLLGLAFDPQYATNGYFYVNYTRNNPLRTVISRFHVSSNPDSADRSSEYLLLQFSQPFSNHNGGQLAFGSDGYLYIGTGDGGSGGDPLGSGQSKTTLLGKVLRIDASTPSGSLHYTIPPSNPFAGNISGYREEIYAYGLRNPWRFSFDYPGGGTLWLADVGQGTWEEIDTIRNGGNYGWNIMEGKHCFNPSSGCDTTGLILPLYDYQHLSGRCSVTGGFVYRGTTIPSLVGKYIFGDYCTGEIWQMNRSTLAVSPLISAGFNISSFGVDRQNELYVCDLSSGSIWKLTIPSPATPLLLDPSDRSGNIPASPTLIWHPSQYAGSYTLQVSTDSTFASFAVNDSTISDTTKQVGPLANSTTFFWRVRAKNGGGASSYSVSRRFTTETGFPPGAPALVSPPDGATNVPTLLSLMWNRTSGAVTYHLAVASDSLFAGIVVDDSTITDTSSIAGPLNTLTTYYWRVGARNSAGSSPFSPARSFVTESLATRLYHFRRGWNLISLGLNPANAGTNALFPMANSQLFSYVPGTGYLAKDTLAAGVGYWLKFPDTTDVEISGYPLSTDSIQIAAGWNIIGGLTSAVPVDSVIQIPPGILASQFYGYLTSYVVSASLAPGEGYWIKSNGPGVLVLRGGSFSQPMRKLNRTTGAGK